MHGIGPLEHQGAPHEKNEELPPAPVFEFHRAGGVKDAGEEADEADRLVAEHWKPVLATLDVANDDFIRTTEPRHHRFVTEIYEKVAAQGDTYKGFYEGEYCVACETFYTETQLQDGKCPVHGTPTSRVKEESYFFRLGKYREWIREHIPAADRVFEIVEHPPTMSDAPRPRCMNP